MVQPIGPITGLAGQTRLIEDQAQASPEARSGNAVDPRHGQWGEQARPYPWQSSLAMGGTHGPYGLENSLLDDEYWWLSPAGDPGADVTRDMTPYRSHGGPQPKGILSGPIPGATPDDIADQLQQSKSIHAINTNAGTRAMVPPQALGIQNDQWEDFWVMNEGDTRVQPVSRQQMSTSFMYGSRDRVTSFARQNEYGFDTAHMHRRYATGSLPGNTYWMKPGGRPLVKNIPTVARPAIGPDSPFNGDDVMFDYNPQGAVLMATPPVYVPPAQPNLGANPANRAASDSGALVEWY